MHPLLSNVPIAAGDVVSIAGSGGKTSLMFALAHDLVHAGMRVITTTTTHIFSPTLDQSPQVVLFDDSPDPWADVKRLISRFNHLTVAQKSLPNGKLKGPPPEIVDSMAQHKWADVILVEADGARGRPLKAPNETEPVIPLSTTWMLAVLGLDGIDKPNSEEFVFRPERFARLGDIPIGSNITPPAAATVLLHPQGILRDAPRGARIAIFLNKGDSEQRLEQGKIVLEAIDQKRSERIEKILITTLLPVPRVLYSFNGLVGSNLQTEIKPDS